MSALYDPTYWDNLRANDGDTPQRVDEARWWEMLEVLPPADWHRGRAFECFRVDEAQCADLYTWLVRIGTKDDAEYWEMIAPRRIPHGGLLLRIQNAQKVTV